MDNIFIGVLLALIFAAIILGVLEWARRDRKRVVLDAPVGSWNFTREQAEKAVRNAKGRTLEIWETDLLNKSKGFEAELLDFIEAQFSTGSCDDRWLAIARTDLQKGFMAMNRAITKPGDANVPEPLVAAEVDPALEGTNLGAEIRRLGKTGEGEGLY